MVESGALDALVTCMEEFDPQVKESAAWALGYIARHSTELAQEVVDAGAVPLLILSLQEPEISLKRISASTLSDISKHSPELAQTVVDSGAVAYLAPLIENKDAKLRRQVFSVLSQLAKHTVELAERVVEAEVFPAALPSLRGIHMCILPTFWFPPYYFLCSFLFILFTSLHPFNFLPPSLFLFFLPFFLGHRFLVLSLLSFSPVGGFSIKCTDPDEYVSKNAATLIREVVKHSPELAQLLVNTGGVAACVDYVQAARSNNKIPGIMALGYISSASERLAKAVIVSHAVGPVAQALSTDPSEQVKAAAAWTLGQMGRHSPDHAKAVAQPDAMVFPNLVALARDSDPAGDLHIKVVGCMVLRVVICKLCAHLFLALQPSGFARPGQRFAKMHVPAGSRSPLVSGRSCRYFETHCQPVCQGVCVVVCVCLRAPLLV